jgi:SpoVK/Ycf46/Vps4 family AAA+-type ATPase
VKKSGLLEIAEPDQRGLDAVGGLNVLKAWIMKRKRSYTPAAEAYLLPPPKGVLIVGVPGTGKSLSAKAIGTALGVPTLRLDIGALFNSLVGESESRTRAALNLAEALAPCVVWIDEVDKGLAGASGSGAGDSGVTKRVFGTIITWMQERKRPVFLVATANDVTNLPPEFLRRWDEIFAVDLPTEEERAAIFYIHLQKRKRMPLAQRFNIATDTRASLAITATEEFTGSEIEKVIEAAMYDAFDEDGREFTIDDIISAARRTTPLAQTAKEKIDAIRDWAKTRATWASSKETDTAKVKGRTVKAR